MKILIFGGDLRNKYLFEELLKENIGADLQAYIDKSIDDLSKIKNFDLIVGPIPFSNDNKFVYTPLNERNVLIDDFISLINVNATLMSGTINRNTTNFKYFDLTKDIELYNSNIIPTVEGIIQILLNEIHFTLCSSDVLLLGFGRIGKSLSALLLNFGVNLYVFDQKVNQVSTNINIVRTIDNLNKYQIIINTIPEIILNKNNLSTIQKDVLIIDVASYPGGIDKNNISGIKYIYASGLPGKKAPKTVAINMKKLMMDYIKMHCL